MIIASSLHTYHATMHSRNGNSVWGGGGGGGGNIYRGGDPPICTPMTWATYWCALFGFTGIQRCHVVSLTSSTSPCSLTSHLTAAVLPLETQSNAIPTPWPCYVLALIAAIVLSIRALLSAWHFLLRCNFFKYLFSCRKEIHTP